MAYGMTINEQAKAYVEARRAAESKGYTTLGEAITDLPRSGGTSKV